MANQSSKLKFLRQIFIERREELNLSQAALAERLDWDQSYVAKFERGARDLSIEEFVLYAKALEQDPLKVLAKFMKATADL